MSSIRYLQRRAGTYFYRRRFPIEIARRLSQSHCVLSLSTGQLAVAKRIAACIDAEFYAVVEADHISLRDVRRQLKTVLALALTDYHAALATTLASEIRQAADGTRPSDLGLLGLGTSRSVQRPLIQIAEQSSWAKHDAPLDVPASSRSVAARSTAKSSEKSKLGDLADILISHRTKDGNWDRKTAGQARQIYTLFSRYLAEEHAVIALEGLRQKHLAAFVHFLRFELFKQYGKGAGDAQRTIGEMKQIALSKPESARGIAAPTLNRHLAFLQQLFDFAPSQGVDIDRAITTKGLRARAPKDRRERDARPTMSMQQAETLFHAPCFIGYSNWKQPTQPGAKLFHRGLYWIPLLLYYTGARREELCGLLVTDIGLDEKISFLDIKPNHYRRIKNVQSVRRIPLHPEIIRLGFLTYVRAIANLEFDLLFPDLYSPTSKLPLGDRFYDEFKPVLTATGLREHGLAVHAMRRGFGNNLKQRHVTVEERADLLGHAGQSETDERYCEALEINRAFELILKLPSATSHLVPHPLHLLPWVQDKEPPPFSRRRRSIHKPMPRLPVDYR